MGTNYTSRKFKEFMANNQITHIKTSPYNPTSNGVSERVNYAIANILRINKGNPLAEVIKKIEVHLNFTHHSILNASPMEVISKRSVFDILQKDISRELNECKAREKIKKEKELKIKNSKRKEIRFRVGDKVLRKNVVNDKILDRYLGPFEVVKVSENYGNVWIKEGKRIKRHNVKNLKHYMGE